MLVDVALTKVVCPPKADTPPPAYSPSEDIKQPQTTDTAMETVPIGAVTPVTYQVSYLLYCIPCLSTLAYYCNMWE